MAESIWQGGRLSHVYTPVGRRASGARRFQLASYETLEWDSSGGGTEDFFVLPIGGGSLAGVDVDIADLDAQIGLEFGFYHLEPVIVEPHEADGNSDSWKALHFFGPI